MGSGLLVDFAATFVIVLRNQLGDMLTMSTYHSPTINMIDV